MTATLAISYERSDALELFLALHRELAGRFWWEFSALPRPVTPAVARLLDGVCAWRAGGLDSLPAWLAADSLACLGTAGPTPEIRAGSATVAAAIDAASAELRPVLGSLAELREQAVRAISTRLRLGEVTGPLLAALGVEPAGYVMPLHCVVLAPPPGAGFLADGNRLDAAYVDCRRYRGAMLAESVLTLMSWALLRETGGDGHLSVQLAGRIPGAGPYHRRLRAVLTKILVEMTSGFLVGRTEAGHRPGVDVLGTAWRFPRLVGAAQRHWEPYLRGLTGREQALDALAAELAAASPRWYIDCVDAAALAADFYLLEALAAAGDAGCRNVLARWLPQLAGALAGQIDLVIGAELGHFERADAAVLPAHLAAFLAAVTAGDSQAAWPGVRSELGADRALELAAEAFAGPGAEFGGDAWTPIAVLLRRYLCHRLPQGVFIDQCFTLQHNNGCVFDKCFDVTDVAAVLDAQAAGDLATLARHASAAVRAAWHGHEARRGARHDPAWLGLPRELAAPRPASTQAGWRGLAIEAALPGGVGCGSALGAGEFAAGLERDASGPVRPRRRAHRRMAQPPADRYEQAAATLHTGLGQVRLLLWPRLAPVTVDNFVKLASGRRPWTDPASGRSRCEPFYDGTCFHRRIPGYLIQVGDRTGTGTGGPGYRIADEFHPELDFSRPFLVAMANAGRDSAGSQFFITLAPAPHLTGQYAQFGEVADAPSRAVAAEIGRRCEPVTLHAVTVRAR